MVNSVTNFGRNGLADWLVQRVSAVVLGVFFIWLLAYFCCHGVHTYDQWQALFNCMAVKVFSVLTMLCLCAHAWVGLWTIFTDYIKCAKLRVLLEVLLVLLLLTYVIWTISIFWR